MPFVSVLVSQGSNFVMATGSLSSASLSSLFLPLPHFLSLSRGLFIIDKAGILRQITMNDLPVSYKTMYLNKVMHTPSVVVLTVFVAMWDAPYYYHELHICTQQHMVYYTTVNSYSWGGAYALHTYVGGAFC